MAVGRMPPLMPSSNGGNLPLVPRLFAVSSLKMVVGRWPFRAPARISGIPVRSALPIALASSVALMVVAGSAGSVRAAIPVTILAPVSACHNVRARAVAMMVAAEAAARVRPGQFAITWASAFACPSAPTRSVAPMVVVARAASARMGRFVAAMVCARMPPTIAAMAGASKARGRPARPALRTVDPVLHVATVSASRTKGNPVLSVPKTVVLARATAIAARFTNLPDAMIPISPHVSVRWTPSAATTTGTSCASTKGKSAALSVTAANPVAPASNVAPMAVVVVVAPVRRVPSVRTTCVSRSGPRPAANTWIA